MRCKSNFEHSCVSRTMLLRRLSTDADEWQFVALIARELKWIVAIRVRSRIRINPPNTATLVKTRAFIRIDAYFTRTVTRRRSISELSQKWPDDKVRWQSTKKIIDNGCQSYGQGNFGSSDPFFLTALHAIQHCFSI